MKQGSSVEPFVPAETAWSLLRVDGNPHVPEACCPIAGLERTAPRPVSTEYYLVRVPLLPGCDVIGLPMLGNYQ